MATRRLRAFKRWMKHQGIEYSKALEFTDTLEQGISVKTLSNLKEGDEVSSIPKRSCLTIKTSGARFLIEHAGLDGYLGLSVALMYELSLGQASPWAGYLQILPQNECLPLLWSLEEIDRLLCGTELHKTMKEDKALIYEDWEENILPLLDSELLELDPQCFVVDKYFAAKSLISSRSFEIDDYHGFGMVPLADLFNHKTGAEDVHFTTISCDESDNDFDDDDDDDDTGGDDDPSNIHSKTNGIHTEITGTDFSGSTDSESSALEEDPMVLKMIMVKDVKAGDEVFNTYGLLGNAALLHRYGFTEPDNSYGIVNIDLELVLQWTSSLFSDRYTRSRLSLWRRLNYSGSVDQDSDYFEISNDGEPEIELLILLHTILLPKDSFDKLDLSISAGGNLKGSIGMSLSNKSNIKLQNGSEISKEMLLTKQVCQALTSIADMRDSLYNSNSMEDDMRALEKCCSVRDRKLYHSLVLRVSERRILEKLRVYAAASARSFGTAKSATKRKRQK